MTDETQAAAADDASNQQDQVAEESAPDAPAKSRVEWSEDQQRELNRIVRREVEAARRKAVADAEAVKAREEAERRGEYQKLLATAEAERDEAQRTLRLYEAERTVERAARKLSAEHPEVIFRLIRDDLEFDASGKPTNADDLVATLKKEYPRYFATAAKAAGADAGKTGGERATGDNMDAILRRAAGRR